VVNLYTVHAVINATTRLLDVRIRVPQVPLDGIGTDGLKALRKDPCIFWKLYRR
jgi:hypothetical protein